MHGSRCRTSRPSSAREGGRTRRTAPSATRGGLPVRSRSARFPPRRSATRRSSATPGRPARAWPRGVAVGPPRTPRRAAGSACSRSGGQSTQRRGFHLRRPAGRRASARPDAGCARPALRTRRRVRGLRRNGSGRSVPSRRAARRPQAGTRPVASPTAARRAPRGRRGRAGDRGCRRRVRARRGIPARPAARASAQRRGGGARSRAGRRRPGAA